MAKKKTEEGVEISIEDFVGRIRAEITKEYGKGVCISGQDVLDRKLKVVPWCLSLDTILGGVQEGTWLSLSGMEKHGKTTILMCLAANAQKMGKTVYFMNVEGRFNKHNLTGAEGLDISDDKLVIIESIPGNMLTTQKYLDIAERIIKGHPGSVIIIDSISSLADDKEVEGGLGTQTRGHNQQVITQFINNNAQLVSANKIILAGIVQKIANTSGYGPAMKQKAPTKWFFQADILLDIKNVDKWRVGDQTTGQIVGHLLNMEARTSSLGQPYSSGVTYLRFGKGIDHLYELIQYATSCNMIEKSGSWYNFNFLREFPDLWGGTKLPQYQGADTVYEFLKTNPNILDVFKSEIAKSSSIVIE